MAGALTWRVYTTDRGRLGRLLRDDNLSTAIQPPPPTATNLDPELGRDIRPREAQYEATDGRRRRITIFNATSVAGLPATVSDPDSVGGPVFNLVYRNGEDEDYII